MFSQIPLPKVVADTEPGGNALAAMRKIAEYKKQQLENKYYGPTAEANAMSKLAYSQFAGPQAVASLLNNPEFVSQLKPEELDKLKNYFHNQISQPVNNPFLQLRQQQPKSEGVFNKLLGLLGVNQNENQPQSDSGNLPNLPVPEAFGGQSNATGQNAMIQQNQGAPGQPTTNINRLAANLPTGGYGGINPASVSKAQTSALNAQSTAETTANEDIWKKTQQQDNENAVASQKVIDSITKARQLRTELPRWQKGIGFGELPAVTSSARELDKTINSIANSTAESSQSGHITEKDRDIYSSLKASRSDPDQAFNNLLNFGEGVELRRQEKPAFNQAAREANLTPTQATALWTSYINQRPFYNAKTHQLQNLNTWPEFFTPEKLQESLKPKPRNIEQKKEVSAGSKILSKNVEFPKFDNKNEFKAWYDKQPEVTQKAIRIKLGGK